MRYTELQVTSNFSFLRGGSHPEELVEQAIALGYDRIAITDRNTLAGIVRAHSATKGTNLKIIPAVRLDLVNGFSLLAYPTDKDAYSRLSSLLSIGNLRTEKGKCALYRMDVYRHKQGIKFIIVPPSTLTPLFELEQEFIDVVYEYKRFLGMEVYLGAIRSYQANDSKILYRLNELSIQSGVPLVAMNDVHYHIPERRELQDILTCIREKCTIYDAGFRLHQNAERYLKPIAEMHRLFAQYPDAIARTQEIADACQFSLSELRYVYPEEITSEGRPPMEELVYLAWKGAAERYGDPLPEKVMVNIQHELKFIEEMDYAPYFLTVYDIVREARERKILCQGRGSAANSTVCYVLGITSVDPTKFDLLFERFISSARNEPPDIDVDFEHERREDIIQYIYGKYGRDRSAIVATVTQVHPKGAVRDVAKAMGLSPDAVDRLAKSIWELSDEWFEGKRISGEGFNPEDPHLVKTLDLTRQYVGFPRQLGQHTGGFVITRGKIMDLCPILNARMENRTNIEWNKDDIDALGFLKIDVLALGMLTCIRKAFDLCKQHYDLDLTLANIPQDDPEVYEMISHADTIGVFQIESRAQMSMLPRLRPKNFYDLVIEVAIVRPGPIQGDMVHPYLRRRDGKEKVEYPKKELEEILGRTLGVPLFQEQAMKIAIVAAGFTPAEADELRRSMATFKSKGIVSRLKQKLIDGMVKNGYTAEYAARVFKQLEGFGSYGFPESHAASFALLVYVSAWLKCYYPDVFCAALLNSLPMGFYQPAQVIYDARNHGVKLLPIDINHSTWDNILINEGGKHHSVRLGFRNIKGLSADDIQPLLMDDRKQFANIPSLRIAGASEAALERLADADAFRSINLDRRKASWEVSALPDRLTGMFEGKKADNSQEDGLSLPEMTHSEHVVHDYGSTSFSLKGHPVGFMRDKLAMLGITKTADLKTLKNEMPVKVAGLVLVRQRPGTAKKVCFITIEDETGVANLVVFGNLFEKFRKEVTQSTFLMVQGKVQIEGEVIHVIAERLADYSGFLQQLTKLADQLPNIATFSRADERDDPYTSVNKREGSAKQMQGDLFAKSRDFH